ncbi:MAG: hypothetical protein M3Q29_23070 [Chloroflexota bacterium]|nr:hypothetical protein [Chloroflexota bacterium]
MAYGLVVAPDIDMEIYCEWPRVENGFAIVSQLALDPSVWKVRFSNELEGPDRGLYWQLRYRDPESEAREVWKIDMWLLGEDHPGPRSAGLVQPMREVLTPERRAAILWVEEFEEWFVGHGPLGLSTWRPSVK